MKNEKSVKHIKNMINEEMLEKVTGGMTEEEGPVATTIIAPNMPHDQGSHLGLFREDAKDNING